MDNGIKVGEWAKCSPYSMILRMLIEWNANVSVPRCGPLIILREFFSLKLYDGSVSIAVNAKILLLFFMIGGFTYFYLVKYHCIHNI